MVVWSGNQERRGRECRWTGRLDQVLKDVSDRPMGCTFMGGIQEQVDGQLGLTVFLCV
jgi:hypothetical protein